MKTEIKKSLIVIAEALAGFFFFLLAVFSTVGIIRILYLLAAFLIFPLPKFRKILEKIKIKESFCLPLAVGVFLIAIILSVFISPNMKNTSDEKTSSSKVSGSSLSITSSKSDVLSSDDNTSNIITDSSTVSSDDMNSDVSSDYSDTVTDNIDSSSNSVDSSADSYVSSDIDNTTSDAISSDTDYTSSESSYIEDTSSEVQDDTSSESSSESTDDSNDNYQTGDPDNDDTNGQIVYRTPSGSKYHIDFECANRKNSAYSVTMDQALSAGLGACGTCVY